MKIGTSQDPCVAKAPRGCPLWRRGHLRRRTAAHRSPTAVRPLPLIEGLSPPRGGRSGSMSALPRQTILIAAEVYS